MRKEDWTMFKRPGVAAGCMPEVFDDGVVDTAIANPSGEAR
jgi:hypothetical protein